MMRRENCCFFMGWGFQGLSVFSIGFKNSQLSPASYRSQAIKTKLWGFPGGAVVENLPVNAGDAGSSPGLGRSHMPRSN